MDASGEAVSLAFSYQQPVLSAPSLSSTLLICEYVQLSSYYALQPVAPMSEPGLPQVTQDVELCTWARKVADTLQAVYLLCCWIFLFKDLFLIVCVCVWGICSY